MESLLRVWEDFHEQLEADVTNDDIRALVASVFVAVHVLDDIYSSIEDMTAQVAISTRDLLGKGED